MFSFLNNFKNKNLQFLIDSVLLTFLFSNIFNDSIDNTVHIYAILASFTFWFFFKKKIGFTYFYLFSIFYAALLFFLINFSTPVQDEEIVVHVNYGCPNHFLDLIRLSSNN
jgi:hypothetical protein